MILEKQSELSDSQVVTATAISTNVIDTLLTQYPFLIGEANLTAATNTGTDYTKDIGIGEPLWLVLQCDVTATAGGAATNTITFESSDAAALTSPTVHATTVAFSIAQMVGGTTLTALMPPSGLYKQFLGVRYTIATGPLTAGSFSAFMSRNLQRNVIYPSAWIIG